MNILDVIISRLDRREVIELRKYKAEATLEIATQSEIIRQQDSSIYNANGRIKRITENNLELKKFIRDNGLDDKGIPA